MFFAGQTPINKMVEAKKRVLVVDDLPDNLLLIENILEEEGYDLVLVEDGFAALASIERRIPDLILLDVMMPVLDGFELTRKIRHDQTLPFIPILLITASDRPSAVRGLDIGADDFIRKPIAIDELLARVRSLLRLKQSIDDREEMTKIREDFVARLTHDLRTPLFAAERMLSLLQQGVVEELSPQMAQIVQTMAQSNRHLVGMVNNLLEVYRYEACGKTLHYSSLDLQKIVSTVVAELQFLAEEKNLTLNYVDVVGEEMAIWGDFLELHRSKYRQLSPKLSLLLPILVAALRRRIYPFFLLVFAKDKIIILAVVWGYIYLNILLGI
jgi:two-component system, sensor histidine kinase and response regulator